MTESESEYKRIVKHPEFEEEKSSSSRFQSISTREDRSNLPSEVWELLAVKYAYKSSWRGILLNKGPIELAIYPMLIDELRPATIIEFGALNGGSGVWMSDIAGALGFAPRILSIDIDLSLLHPTAKADERVEFIQGDVHFVSTILPSEVLNECKHPWLVIEDCHVNTIGILDYLDANGIQGGDYVIVEDTNQDAWDAWRSRWMSDDRVKRGKSKLPSLRNWAVQHPAYVIDTFYQDFYGYNVGKNWNSILKHIGTPD